MGCKPGVRHESYDWPLLKSEYLNGVPMREIAEKYQVNLNTLHVTASRKNWKAERVKTGDTRVDCVVKSINKSLAEDAQAFTAIVTRGINKAAEALFNREMPQDPYQANALTGAMQKVNDMGRKTFGLEDSNAIKVTVGLVGLLPDAGQAPLTLDVESQRTLTAGEAPVNTGQLDISDVVRTNVNDPEGTEKASFSDPPDQPS